MVVVGRVLHQGSVIWAPHTQHLNLIACEGKQPRMETKQKAGRDTSCTWRMLSYKKRIRKRNISCGPPRINPQSANYLFRFCPWNAVYTYVTGHLLVKRSLHTLHYASMRTFSMWFKLGAFPALVFPASYKAPNSMWLCESEQFQKWCNQKYRQDSQTAHARYVCLYPMLFSSFQSICLTSQHLQPTGEVVPPARWKGKSNTLIPLCHHYLPWGEPVHCMWPVDSRHHWCGCPQRLCRSGFHWWPHQTQQIHHHQLWGMLRSSRGHLHQGELWRLQWEGCTWNKTFKKTSDTSFSLVRENFPLHYQTNLDCSFYNYLGHSD